MKNIRIITLIVIGFFCFDLLVSPVLGDWISLPDKKAAKLNILGIDESTAQNMAKTSVKYLNAMLEADGYGLSSMSPEEVETLHKEIVDSIYGAKQNENYTGKFRFRATPLGLLEFSDGKLTKVLLDYADMAVKLIVEGVDPNIAQSMAEDATEQLIVMLEAEGYALSSMSQEEIKQLHDEIVDSIQDVEQNANGMWKFTFHTGPLGLLVHHGAATTPHEAILIF